MFVSINALDATKSFKATARRSEAGASLSIEFGGDVIQIIGLDADAERFERVAKAFNDCGVSIVAPASLTLPLAAE